MYNSYSNFTKEQVINDIKCKKVCFYDLCKKHQKDKDIVIEFVKNSDEHISLINIISEWYDNFDVMFELVKKDEWALKYTSERLKNDKSLVLEAVKKSGYALRFTNDDFKGDIEIVYEALKQNGLALQFVPVKLRQIKSIVLEAVKNNAIALTWASNELQNDRQLLEILEKRDIKKNLDISVKKWYKERMEVLANIREKEFIEKAITLNNIKVKKIKF